MKNTRNPNTNQVLTECHAMTALVQTVDSLVRAADREGTVTENDVKLAKSVRKALSAFVDILREAD